MDEIHKLFANKQRLQTDKVLDTWQMKIMRAHKIGELQRDEETKRAWFTVGQTHSSHIEQSKTYSDEENQRLFGLVDWDVLGETKFVQIVGK